MALPMAYAGTQIAGFRPKVAPNKSCCTDAGVLCPKCAAKALANSPAYDPFSDPPGTIHPRVTANFADGDQDMAVPVLFAEQPTGGLIHNASMVGEDQDDVGMVCPTINWAADPRQKPASRLDPVATNTTPSRRFEDEDSDMAPVPMKFK